MSEATAFTLHSVKGSFTGAAINRTPRVRKLLSRISDAIDAHRPILLERAGQSAARLTTHLRLLFVRLADGRTVPLVPPLVRAGPEKPAPSELSP